MNIQKVLGYLDRLENHDGYDLVNMVIFNDGSGRIQFGENNKFICGFRNLEDLENKINVYFSEP